MIYQTPETREKILSAAQELFAERGLFDTQMKDIATSVGISRTSLYRYFLDKEDLAMAILERMSSEMDRSDSESEKQPGATGLERLERYLRKSRWLWPGHDLYLRYMAEFDAYFSGSRVPNDFRVRLRQALHGSADQAVVKSIEEGIQDGSIRADLDPHLTMSTIFNALRGLQQRLLLRGETLIEVKPGEPDKMLTELLRLLMQGIAAEKPPAD